MATPFRQDGSPVKRVAVLAAKRAVVWRRGFSQGDLRCFVKTGVVGRDLLRSPYLAETASVCVEKWLKAVGSLELDRLHLGANPVDLVGNCRVWRTCPRDCLPR